ncbi:ABC transporter substrate-binding protein [Cohnella hongkongensis]|uniref:ABC transporter substrate-binding protein n=1 Tax=Cohnella hongkongensis TaxID=178337 RepID=A0ABV9FHB5_9BACL
MNRRNWVMMLTLFVTMALIASACSGASQRDSGSSAAPASNGSSVVQSEESPAEVKLRFAWWGNDPRHQATLEALGKYMELHPHVKIEAEYMGFDGYVKKLATQFAGRAAPDVFQYGNAFSDQLGDFVYDLQEVRNLIDLSTFPESTIRDSAMWRDKMTLIPAGIIAAATIYNADFFDKYGIPHDTVWTWDNLLEIGAKVHEQNSGAYLITADSDVIDKLILVPYITQKSGELWVNDDYTMNVTEEQLTEAYTYLMELYERGVLEPFGDSTAFVGKMEQNPKWVKGEIGMLFDYVAAYEKYAAAISEATIAVGPFPMHADAVQSANPLVTSNGFAVNKDSEYKEEAAKLINWLVNDPEAAVILGTHRGTPASSSALQAITEAGVLNPQVKLGIELATQHESLPLTPLSDSPNVRVVHAESVQKVIYGRSTPQEASAEAIRNMAEKLAEMKAEAQ